jgi:hypothetical protein
LWITVVDKVGGRLSPSSLSGIGLAPFYSQDSFRNKSGFKNEKVVESSTIESSINPKG